MARAERLVYRPRPMTDFQATPQIFTVPPEAAGERLDVFLARVAAPLSRSRLKALIESGAVTRDGAAITQAKAEISVGETYALRVPPPASAAPQAEAIALDILFEDADLIVLNKAAGMTVHPAPGASTGTLVHALLHHCKGQLSGIGGVERPGIVHRLDKLTSGVMVAAKSEAAHVGLAAQFAEHTLERAYSAFVRSAPPLPAGKIDARLQRDRNDPTKIAVTRSEDRGRHAITHFKTEATYGETREKKAPIASLVDCRLETGRTHQVRVHMAHIHCPLIGDPVYAKGSALALAHIEVKKADAVKAAIAALDRQALHARVLGFEHPATGKTLRFETPLPADLQKLKSALEGLA